MIRQLLLIILLISVLPAHNIAQDRTMGPKAKNLKAWEKEAATVSTDVESRPLSTGPSAKNQKVWNKSHSGDVTIAVEVEKKQLYGVQAKNAKVWEDNEVSDRQNKIPRFIAPVLILIILGL